jgi:hypothetical protein
MGRCVKWFLWVFHNFLLATDPALSVGYGSFGGHRLNRSAAVVVKSLLKKDEGGAGWARGVRQPALPLD